MLANYTHSRAAVLCLGGWGLQVMLHLAPRLEAAQEQRAALGYPTPDLNRITSFGAVMAEPLLAGDGRARLIMRRIKPNQPLAPYFVERVIAGIKNGPTNALDERAASLLTDSERRAMLLLRGSESVLQPIGYEGYELQTQAAGLASLGRRPIAGANLRRATRSDIFQTALQHADAIARLLETYVFDPIRQDNLAPNDPFVQTTLYLIAPLFEPLSAALLWPVASALMARLTRRHISNVVAMLATGSYANDLTRSVEDACAYSVLSELEVLTGVRRDPQTHALLANEVARANPTLAAHVGEYLFDYIYLLDREKANQALAEESHELAVLAGNALEALIVGAGDLHIQEQLGFSLSGVRGNGEERPYSLIGAAADYVPLHQVFHAVGRQEESRLVRDWVLRNTPEEPPAPNLLARIASGNTAQPTLVDLGFSPAKALSHLVERLPDLFVNPNPESIDDLAVKHSFVFPKAAAAGLRRLSPAEWPAAFENHLAQIRSYIDLVAGPNAVDEAWGLNAPTLENGIEGDDRLYPQLLARMNRRLLDQLAASPTGLTRATNQAQRWLHEAEEMLQKLQVASTPSTRQINNIQHELALREWTLDHERITARLPGLFGVVSRAVLATALVALLAFLYVVIAGRTWDPDADGMALAGFGVGMLVAALITLRLSGARQSRIRRARVNLAQAALTDELQLTAHAGLVRAYQRVVEVVRAWHEMLAEAMQELHALSTPPRAPSVPPPDAPQTYLYMPHLNQALWDRSQAYLRTHLDSHGHRSEERLDDLWGQARWRNQMQRILRNISATASNSGAGGRTQAKTLAEFIRQTVRESVAPVSLQEPNPVRAELIRAISGEYSVEHMLWRGEEDAEAIERRLRAMAIGAGLGDPGAPSIAQQGSAANRRYVEAAWHRAKPTGNYDVADRLAVYGITIDFAAVSGSPDSDVSRSLLDEFNITLLPTQNPFTLIFVRTVHCLALDDLDCMRRYRNETRFLTPEERALLFLGGS